MSYKNLTETIAQRVKQLIREYDTEHPDNKLTQRRLAKEVLYTHEGAVSYKMNGSRNFTPLDVQRLAEFFSVSPKWLTGETNYRSRLDEWRAIKSEQSENFSSLCKVLEILCSLKGIKLTTPPPTFRTLSNLQELEQFFKYEKSGFVFTDGNRQVTMSLQEFLTFGNKLLDHFTIELLSLFDNNSVTYEIVDLDDKEANREFMNLEGE